MCPAANSKLASWAKLTFSPLRSPLFLLFWLSGMASNLGGVVRSIAASWYMVSLTDSAMMVTLVQSAITIPLTMFALVAGAVADLFDRRKQMIAALSFSALIAFVLVTSIARGTLTPVELLVYTFLIGTGTAFYVPAWQSSLIEVVPKAKLGQAVSLNSLSGNITLSAGPLIGAEILAIAGAAVAFFVHAISSLGLIVVLLLWKRPTAKRTLPRESLGRAMMDGLRFVGLSPTVRGIMLRGFLLAFGCAGLMSLPPVLAVQLQGGPRALGALMSGFGVGAMLGALMTSRLRLAMSIHRLEMFATIVAAASLVVLAFSHWLQLSVLAMAAAGAAWAIAVSTLQLSVHTSCPRWVTGRALSIFMMTFYLGVAGGSAAAGAVASITDASTALLFGAGFLIMALLLVNIFVNEDAHPADLEPHEDLLPNPGGAIDPRSGPVVVTIDYRVPPANAEPFMAAMYALGRVRRRDGARKWSLTQDIDDTDLWLERFHSPTWTDYLHRVSRRVVADLPLHQCVLDLCSERPVSHRRLERPAGSSPLPTAKHTA